jgi:hypothetical protein
MGRHLSRIEHGSVRFLLRPAADQSRRDCAKDRSGSTGQGSVQAWLAARDEALVQLKTTRIHNEGRRNPPPGPGKIAKPEEPGRTRVGNQVLDLAGKPGPGFHLAGHEGEKGNQPNAEPRRREAPRAGA